MDLLIFLLFGLGLMWLVVVLPQRRRQDAQRRMLQALKAGDYVVTAGGMYGTVTELGEEDLGLEIAPDVEVRVAKRSIGAVIPPEDIEEVEEAEEGGAAAAEPAAVDGAPPEPSGSTRG